MTRVINILRKMDESCYVQIKSEPADGAAVYTGMVDNVPRDFQVRNVKKIEPVAVRNFPWAMLVIYVY